MSKRVTDTLHAVRSAAAPPNDALAAAGANSATLRGVGRNRTLTLAAILLAMAMAAAPAWLIVRYGVSLPYWDEWDLSPYVLDGVQGRLNPVRLLDQHNESRLVVPRVLVIAMAKLTGVWDARHAMALSVGLAAIAAGMVAWMVMRLPTRSRIAAAVVAVSVGWLILSPTQQGNWLWGLELSVYLPVLTLVAATAALSLASVSLMSRVIVAGLLLTIGSLSHAGGLPAWFAVIPVVAAAMAAECIRQRNGDRAVAGGPGRSESVANGSTPRVFLPAVVYGLWMATLIGLYFVGYDKPSNSPSLASVVVRPVALAEFALALLGSPHVLGFGRSIPAAMLIAAALLVAGGWACWRIVRRGDRGLWILAAPFAALALHALAAASIAATGRMGLGIEHALASRYATVALLLPIGILPLILAATSGFQTRAEDAADSVDPRSTTDAGRLLPRVPASHPRARPWLAPAAAGLILALQVVGVPSAIDDAAVSQMLRRQWAAALHFSPIAPSPQVLQRLYPILDMPAAPAANHRTPDQDPSGAVRRDGDTPAAGRRGLIPWSRRADELRLLRPRLWTDAMIAGDLVHVADPSAGELESLTRDAGGWRVSGWAILPERQTLADAVVLLIDLGAGGFRVVGLATDRLERPDLPAGSAQDLKAFAGWTGRLTDAPPANATVRAAAYDADTGRLSLLTGGANIVP